MAGLLVTAGIGLLAFAGPSEVLAAKVGVTSAVQPQALGAAPGSEPTVLRIGVDVVENQRITTSDGGRVQLVFLDGSALTVGPNSDVVLDKFLYDPASESGELSFAATRGVFRLVGGKLSKKTPVKLSIGVATMGIRGGIAMAQGDGNMQAIFVYGEEMTLTSGGSTQTVNRPGFQINVPGAGNPPSPPVPADTALLGQTLDQLEADPQSPQGTGAGQPGVQRAVSDEDVDDSQIPEMVSGNGPDDDGGAGPVTVQFNVQDVAPEQEARRPTQQAPQEELEVVPGGSTPSGGGGGGGGCTGLCLTGFNAHSKHGTSTATGGNDASATENVDLVSLSIGDGVFQAGSNAGVFQLFFPAAAGSFTVGSGNSPTTTPYGSVTGTGMLTSDLEFILYKLTGSSGRTVVFGGVPTANSSFPTTGVTAHALDTDYLRASDLPFMDHIATSNHGMLYTQWAANSALPVFGGGTVLISGSGTSQKSGWLSLYGELRDDPAGGKHLQGNLRSQGLYDASLPAVKFIGSIASADAGSRDFFGGTAADYVVLESASVNASDVVQSRGISRVSHTATTTFNSTVAALTTTSSLTSATRTAGSNATRGFAAGTAIRFNSSGITSTAILRNRNNSPNDVTLTTNADMNSLSATFRLADTVTSDNYDLFFGDSTQTGTSAFINDSLLFAGESSASSSTITGRILGEPANLGLVSSGALQHDGLLPTGVSFCSCQFLRWGFFGATYDVTSGSNEQIHLATWLQGSLTDFASFPTSGTAQYKGHVIGSVVNQANQYVAVGGMTLNVGFAAGSFQLTGVQIDSFDGINLTSTGASGNFTINRYNSTGMTIQGNKTGVGNVTAVVHGAFFGSGTGAPPETGGTVTMTGTNYQSGGTFGATRQ